MPSSPCRPFVVIGWLYETFNDAVRNGYVLNEDNYLTAMQKCNDACKHIFSMLDTQLPYTYVHTLHLVMFIVLITRSSEIGLQLAVNFEQRESGNNTFDDDTDEWPVSPNVWFGYTCVVLVIKNLYFSLFLEGLVTMCDNIQNPLDDRAISLSYLACDQDLIANAGAMSAGIYSYEDISKPLHHNYSNNDISPAPTSAGMEYYQHGCELMRPVYKCAMHIIIQICM